MKQPTGSEPLEETPTPGWLLLLQLVLGMLGGAICFVLLWAGLNVAWGATLDAAIAPALVAAPCQRLTTTSERPTVVS